MVGNFKDYLESMKKVDDYTVNGKCSSCGGCCSRLLWISKHEVNVIRDYIKIHQIRPVKQVFPLENKWLDLTCPFRDNEQKKCLIYPVRPLICKLFSCHVPKPTTDKINRLKKIGVEAQDMRSIFGDL